MADKFSYGSGSKNPVFHQGGSVSPLPNLVVVSTFVTPAVFSTGVHVTPTAIIQNAGGQATSQGFIHAVTFYIDGNVVGWDATSTVSLQVLQTRSLTMSNSSTSTSYWVATTTGTHSLQATVNNRNPIITESSTLDNTYAIQISVAATGGGGGGGTTTTTTWLPSDLTPSTWLDFASTGTILASTTAVATVTSRYSGGTSVSQATIALKPATNVATINSKNALRGVGTQWIGNATFSIAQPFSVLLVGACRSLVTADETFYDLGLQPTTPGPQLETATSDQKWLLYAGTSAPTGISPDTAAHSYVVVHNGAATTFIVDGATLATVNPGTQSAASLRLFGTNDGNPGDMDIGEFVVVPGIINAANIAQWSAYAHTKWATADNTPAGGGGGGGGGGTLGDTTTGAAAYRLIGWGAGDWLYGDQAFHQQWKDSNGFGGCVYLHSYPYGIPGGADNFRGTTAAGAGSEFNVQKQLEGLNPSGSNPARMGVNARAVGNKSYIGVRFQSDEQLSGAAPFGVPWSDTTTRGTVATFMGNMAGAAKLCSIDGIAGDFEPYYNKTWDATTFTGAGAVGVNRGNAYAWGLAIGQAVFAAYPGCEFICYSFYMPDGWNMVQLQSPGTNNSELKIDFFHGYLKAMADAASGGRLILLDATFYRPDPQKSGATLANALKYNTQGPLAKFSNYFSSGVWNYVCDKIDISPFSWAGTDPSSFYINSIPGEPAYASTQDVYRTWGMGGIRAEYNYEGSPDLATNSNIGPSGTNYYTYNGTNPPGGHGAGMVAAASPAKITTVVPTITNVGHTALSGGASTVTCRAAHAYGIRCVQAFVGTTYLGAFQMVWTQNGGDYTTNYDNAYMACTINLTGRTAGDVITIHAISTKDDTHDDATTTL